MDITYIPMARGFVYLAAVVDWFSRRVLAWRLSITMEVDFCLEAVEEALARHGKPEIFNTDQGSQFTSAGLHRPAARRTRSRSAWTARARWRDNVFVERLWRSVKYEEVYLQGLRQRRRGARLDRPVSGLLQRQAGPIRALDARTPDQAYFDHLPLVEGRMNFRRRCWRVTPVGLRPPCVTSQQRRSTNRQRFHLSRRRSLSRRTRPPLFSAWALP